MLRGLRFGGSGLAALVVGLGAASGGVAGWAVGSRARMALDEISRDRILLSMAALNQSGESADTELIAFNMCNLMARLCACRGRVAKALIPGLGCVPNPHRVVYAASTAPYDDGPTGNAAGLFFIW
jgi:hypothetical protein